LVISNTPSNYFADKSIFINKAEASNNYDELEMQYVDTKTELADSKKANEINKIKLVAKQLEIDKYNEIIKIFKNKMDIRAIIEHHIMNVNHLIFPQLAVIISNAIIEAERTYPNISYDIILAVMELESTFKYTAKSTKDCIGLMQVNPAVWTEELIKVGIIVNKLDLYDPTKNILAGTHILNEYYEQVESKDVKLKWEGALSKYFGAESKEYFDKFQKFFGNFHLIMASNKK